MYLIITLAVNIVGAFIWFFLGYLWKWIVWISPKRCFFSKVFGKKTWEGNFYIVIDSFFDERPNSKLRYLKIMPSNRPSKRINGPQGLIGLYMARTINYLSSYLSEYLKPKFDTDLALHGKWEGTFICLGSPNSNSKTNEIINLKENSCLKFSDDGSYIINMKNNRQITINNDNDYGIILKLNNSFFQGYTLFICAGLGEFGTSGSAYYLARYWQNLGKKFGNRPFGAIIEIRHGSDESARMIDYATDQSQTIFLQFGYFLKRSILDARNIASHIISKMIHK